MRNSVKKTLHAQAEHVKDFGTHAVFVRLTGKVNTKSFFHGVRQYIRRILGTTDGIRYIWFCAAETSEKSGVYVAITGDMINMELVMKYLRRQHVGAEHTHIEYAGWKRRTFKDLVNHTLLFYYQVPNTKSHGATYIPKHEARAA